MVLLALTLITCSLITIGIGFGMVWWAYKLTSTQQDDN